MKDNGCPHITDMQMQSYWCCYIKNAMVDKNDCKKCKYGKIINLKQEEIKNEYGKIRKYV